MPDQKQDERPILGIIGAGKVGRTLARLLYNQGYTIAAVHSRTPAHAAQLARKVEASAVDTHAEVIDHAQLTILAVPDDAIEIVAESLCCNVHGKAIIHTSGAHDASVLTHLKEEGAMVGGLHPAFPFSDVERAIATLPGATFALDATEPQLIEWLKDVIVALNGETIMIPPGGKGLYHAALVIASNYTVSLYAIAARLLESIGANRRISHNALNALLRATADNLVAQGVPDALTGPLVREDVGTIKTHLDALPEDIAQLYMMLARQSYGMLIERGIPTDEIEAVLKQGEEHATNHTRYPEDER